MQPISIGHIRWSSAHLPPQQQQQQAATAWHHQQSEQMRQDAVRQQRLLELAVLSKADSNVLLSLLTYVCELCPRLPRKVAAALLQSEQLGGLLDLKVLWPHEVRDNLRALAVGCQCNCCRSQGAEYWRCQL